MLEVMKLQKKFSSEAFTVLADSFTPGLRRC